MIFDVSQVERLDEATRSRSSSPTGQRALSLQSEMEMSGFGLSSTSLELVEMMPGSVEFEKNGFPSRHCDVIPESEEMDTDSSDCDQDDEEDEEEDVVDNSKLEEEQLMGELRQEVLSCYSQLRNMGSLLRARERGRAIDGESLDTSSSSGSSSVTSQALRVRMRETNFDLRTDTSFSRLASWWPPWGRWRPCSFGSKGNPGVSHHRNRSAWK